MPYTANDLKLAKQGGTIEKAACNTYRPLIKEIGWLLPSRLN